MKLTNYNQLEKFLIDNISDFHFGLLLCMHTGIRVGELSGLRWEDVDFIQHKIRIQRTVIRIKNLDQTANPDTGKIPKTILYIGPPKTEHSNREIPLPDKLLFYAKRFRKDGSAYILSGTARCMEPRVIQRRYAALLKTCGIPPLKSMLSGISSPVAGWNMASIPSPCPKYLDILPCELHWICMCISRRKRSDSI